MDHDQWYICNGNQALLVSWHLIDLTFHRLFSKQGETRVQEEREEGMIVIICQVSILHANNCFKQNKKKLFLGCWDEFYGSFKNTGRLGQLHYKSLTLHSNFIRLGIKTTVTTSTKQKYIHIRFLCEFYPLVTFICPHPHIVLPIKSTLYPSLNSY